MTYNINHTAINAHRGIEDPQQTGISTNVQTGFIAQEVEEAAQKANYDFSGIDAPQNEEDNYGLRYAEFVTPLVKAIQEQQKMIEELQLKIKELESAQNNNN